MNIFTALLLGVIQGFTEFLPISSSGHLVLAQSLIPGFSQPGILFDVVLHGGTLVAVLFYFRKKLLHLARKEMILLLIGTVPAVFAGLLLGDFLESTFSDLKSLALQFVITAMLCFAIDKAKATKDLITPKNALTIGIAQAIAILPAISRSGATIFAATRLGIERKKAAEFSFLLSIPAIAGAIVMQFIKYNGQIEIDPVYYGGGFIASFIIGFLSIGVLLKLLSQKNFKFFGVYCLILALIIFLL